MIISTTPEKAWNIWIETVERWERANAFMPPIPPSTGVKFSDLTGNQKACVEAYYRRLKSEKEVYDRIIRGLVRAIEAFEKEGEDNEFVIYVKDDNGIAIGLGFNSLATDADKILELLVATASNS